MTSIQSPESTIADSTRLRAGALQNELIDLSLAQAPLAELVACLSARIGNPVALADPLFHLLASAPAAAHGDAHRRESVERRGTPRSVLDDPVAGAKFREVVETRHTVHFPAYPEHGMDLSRMMTPVLAGEEILGFITALEETRFEPDLAFLLEQAAKVIGLDLLQKRAAVETERHLVTDFLGDLLSGRIGDRDSLVRRAGYLGIDLFRSWTLLVIEADDLEWLTSATRAPNPVIAVHHLVDVVSRVARQSNRRAIVVVQGDSAVVLMPERSRERDPIAAASQLQSDIASFLGASTVSIAVSAPCATIDDFSVRYAEARRALDISHALKRTAAIVTLEEFGLYGLLFRRDDQDYLDRYIDRLLGPLSRPGNERETTLLQTLTAYLEEGGAFRATARRLDIHPNTLRGRLSRIEELTQLDLHDPRTRTELSIAVELRSVSRT
ncbi:MAG: helix-turn-helix domain-containing protein [Thermomicrobiales bacterium]|nr:helix-turn-helix domain-containing protein [Thermomicrobiales bacterium]